MVELVEVVGLVDLGTNHRRTFGWVTGMGRNGAM